MGTVKIIEKQQEVFWNLFRDEPNNPPLNDDDPPTINYNADPITNCQYFKYKSGITRKTSNANQENGENPEQGNTKTKKNLGIVVPLKYLSKFGRSLNMPLINSEVSVTLIWSENCVLTNITTENVAAATGDNLSRERIDAPTNAIFKMTGTKLYMPVVTL